MQAQYKDDIVGSVEDFDQNKLRTMLEDGAESVSVFKIGTPAHNKAIKKYSQMTANQKKRLRKQQRK